MLEDALPSPLYLIQANLMDTSPFCRHLMLLTESSAALRLLFECKLLKRETTVVLVGSQFPRDANNELRMVRQINEIKHAMQSGLTVVLVNHEGIFPSLYDVLNMRYTTKRSTETGKTVRMLRLAVGNRSQWCSVGEGFKIIVIVEKRDAYEKLDLPLLNRFEKQMLRASDALEDNLFGLEQLAMLEAYVRDIQEESKVLQPFVGLYSQTLPSLILTASPHAPIDELKQRLHALVSPLVKLRLRNSAFLFLEKEGDLQSHVDDCVRSRTHLLLLTFSSSHDFEILMQNQLEGVIALSGVTSEREFVQALKISTRNTVKFVQCDPLRTNQDCIEHARYLALQESFRDPRLTVVFIVHLPPAAGQKNARNFAVDFQHHWKTVFVDDLLHRPERLNELLLLSPVQWALEKDNLLTVCRSKLSMALLQAKQPLKGGKTEKNVRDRMLHIHKLLLDASFFPLFQETILFVLSQSKESALELVTRGEARTGTVTRSIILAFEMIVIRSFSLTLRWLDTNFNLDLASHKLWTVLHVNPTPEFLAIQQQLQQSDMFCGNCGRPGFPVVSQFPWSWRIFDILSSAKSNAHSVLKALIGNEAYELANQHVSAYLADICTFSAFRRIELSASEQVFLTQNWIAHVRPDALFNIVDVHQCFLEEQWALFSLLSIRIALMDVDFSDHIWHMETKNVLGPVFDSLLEFSKSNYDDQRVWLNCVNKVKTQVHTRFLETQQQAHKFASLLCRAVYEETAGFDNYKTGSFDFSSFYPYSAIFVQRVAQSVVSLTWFDNEEYMWDLLEYAMSNRKSASFIVLAICRHPVRSVRIDHMLDDSLLDVSLALAEDLLEDSSFFPTEKIKAMCLKRKSIRRMISTNDFSTFSWRDESEESLLARAFLVNELLSTYGEFGLVDMVSTNQDLTSIFQSSSNTRRSSLLLNSKKLTVLDLQRLNSGVLLFGESLYREIQEVMKVYGFTPGSTLFSPEDEDHLKRKQEKVQAVYETIRAKRPSTKVMELWTYTLNRLKRCGQCFHELLLALIYQACVCSIVQTSSFLSLQFLRFLEDMICFSAERNWLHHRALRDRKLYLHLAQLSCSDVSAPCWQRLIEQGSVSSQTKLFLIQLACSALLSEEEMESNLLGDLLRGGMSKASVNECFIPAMSRDDWEMFQNALGFVGWWSCPKGHRYAVGECTMPMQESTCPECGAPIGGTNHTAVKGVTRLNDEDGSEIKSGYRPPEEGNLEGSMRSLESGAVCFYQLCFHGILLLNPDMDAVIAKPHNSNNRRVKFRHTLWHLFTVFKNQWKKEAAVGEDKLGEVEDALLLGMLALCTCNLVFSIPTQRLRIVESQRRAENDLNLAWCWSGSGVDRTVVLRVGALQSQLGMANVKREIAQTVSTEVFTVSEVLLTKEHLNKNHLPWAFRVPIGMQDLLVSLRDSYQVFPLLNTFCRVESDLKLISCLTDVLEWSQVLTQALSFRKKKLTREEAGQLSNGNAIALFPLEHQRVYATQVLDRFCDAFNASFYLVPFLYECQRNPFLVGNLVDLSGLHGQGSSRMEMTVDTPVSFSLVAIVPGDADAQSLCLFQLVRALQHLNNNLLEELTHNQGMQMEVPITTMSTPRSVISSRLIQYDRNRDLLPLLAVFSSKALGMQSRSLDLNELCVAIRQHFMLQSPIRVAIPQFEYAGESKRRGTLALLKVRVPQVELPPSLVASILQEVDSDSTIQPLWELVDSCIAFLASFEGAGLDSKMLVYDFASQVLELETGIQNCPSVKHQVTIGHLASLYLVLEEAESGLSLEELVHPKYKTTLSSDLQAELRVLAPCLDLDVLLPILKELLVTRLNTDTFPGDACLADYLEYCTDVQLMDLEWFSKHFPSQLSLNLAYSAFVLWMECT